MSDEDWKPELKEGLDWTRLSLSAEEGFVLSRIDGATSLKNLEQLTGLPQARVAEIVGKLVDEGAIGGARPQASAPAAVDLGPAVPDATVQEAEPVGASDDWTYEYETSEEELDDDEYLFSDDREAAEEEEAQRAARAEPPARPDGEPPDDEARAEQEGGEDGASDDDSDESEESEESEEESREADDDEDAAHQQANYRKLFETELKALERDQRVKLAGEAEGATLCALCFDADPAVIRAVLENMKVGLEHARLIAAHHRNPVGLDALARRVEFLRDGHVQRLLLRNNQASDPLLKRLLANKPLAQLFQLNRGRELTERAKRTARQELRRVFQQASAEERVGLIFTTEGRCLTMLVGLAFDSKTTALLCGRTYNPTMLIQNLLRFSATPPPVLQHLAKQNSVRRTPSLKKLILQHPNCPSQVKRA